MRAERSLVNSRQETGGIALFERRREPAGWYTVFHAAGAANRIQKTDTGRCSCITGIRGAVRPLNGARAGFYTRETRPYRANLMPTSVNTRGLAR